MQLCNRMDIALENRRQRHWIYFKRGAICTARHPLPRGRAQDFNGNSWTLLRRRLKQMVPHAPTSQADMAWAETPTIMSHQVMQQMLATSRHIIGVPHHDAQPPVRWYQDAFAWFAGR